MNVLSKSEIDRFLSQLDNWRLENGVIIKDWVFQDFSEAMDFINMMAVIAEKHNHHPQLFNVYNRVTLYFTTHDAGGITEKDINIAKELDKI